MVVFDAVNSTISGSTEHLADDEFVLSLTDDELVFRLELDLTAELVLLEAELVTLEVELATLIEMVNGAPKVFPVLLLNCHSPRCAPGVLGAVIGTSKSAVCPGSVVGTRIDLAGVIASPFAKTS